MNIIVGQKPNIIAYLQLPTISIGPWPGLQPRQGDFDAGALAGGRCSLDLLRQSIAVSELMKRIKSEHMAEHFAEHVDIFRDILAQCC